MPLTRLKDDYLEQEDGIRFLMADELGNTVACKVSHEALRAPSLWFLGWRSRDAPRCERTRAGAEASVSSNALTGAFSCRESIRFLDVGWPPSWALHSPFRDITIIRPRPAPRLSNYSLTYSRQLREGSS
jgi:hypothetical protein